MSYQRKAPWHLWFLAILFLFIYSNGIYDFFMMLGHQADYYHSKGFGKEVHEYFTNYPIGLLILWILNVFGGMIASLLLLFRMRWVGWISFISALSFFMQHTITFAFRNHWEIIGPFISMFDIGLVIITWAFFLYCIYLKKRRVLK